MPFPLQRLRELLVGLDLVFLADVLDDALELVVAHGVAQFLAALREQQFVDGVDDHLRRHLTEHLGERRVIAAQPAHFRPLTKRGDLPLLEIGLGDDLAVHAHENLLDDVGAEGCTRGGREHQSQRSRV